MSIVALPNKEQRQVMEGLGFEYKFGASETYVAWCHTTTGFYVFFDRDYHGPVPEYITNIMGQYATKRVEDFKNQVTRLLKLK